VRRQLQADALVVFVDLVGLAAAVGDHAAEAHVVVLGLGADRLHDAVHCEDRIEVVGGDDQRAVGVLQRRSEAAADDVAEHVEDHHVGVLEQVVLLQQLDGLADHVATAAGAGRRSAGLDAHHAVVAREDEVLDAQFLGVEIDRLEHVDDGRQHLLRQREGRVVLRVAADLQHALAKLRERGRQVARRGALADAALAVDREHLRVADLHARVEFDLNAALAVEAQVLAHARVLDVGKGYGCRAHA
jgi:hypothetical protein